MKDDDDDDDDASFHDKLTGKEEIFHFSNVPKEQHIARSQFLEVAERRKKNCTVPRGYVTS